MKPNRVKQTLQSGQVSLGTMVFEFSTTGIARLVASAGAEFVLFDMEHTAWSIETIRALLATSGAADIVPLVRAPATEYHFLARVLDAGAMGLMVPMVESAQQAERIVNFAKYPPLGRRGAAFGVSHDDYTSGAITAKIASANQEQLLIAQVETAAGVEQVDAIAAVEGIDVLWIGQTDLSCSLGIPGDFSHPKFQQAVEQVIQACRRHDKAAGFMCLSAAEGAAMLERGFRMLAYSGDLWIYQQALRDGINALHKVRAGLPPGRE